jgi:hypothetical protein
MASAGAAFALAQMPTAFADPLQPPPQFPDIDTYPAADLSGYLRVGDRAVSTAWLFTSPNGCRCRASADWDTA